MSQCLGQINCKTLEFELEIDFDSLWQRYCTSAKFFFNTYSQGAPQIVKTQVVVKLRHTLRRSICVSMSFGITEPHKILGEALQASRSLHRPVGLSGLFFYGTWRS